MMPLGVVIAAWVLIGFICLMLSAAYSGFETGWYQLSEVRLRLRPASVTVSSAYC